MNCAANEALPIFLDELVPQVVAVLLSVTLVLLFGEILPSALFSGPRRLDLGAAMVPLVRGLLFVLTPISWPIAKALDKLLGHEELNTRFDRHQMRTLVELHRARNRKASHGGGGGGDDGGGDGGPGGGLTDTEAQVIFSTLEAHNKTPRDVMTSWERAKTISHGAVLDEAEMVRLMRYGYSRFPVWKGDRNNIVGYLRLQKLLTVSPEDRRPVATFALRKPLVVHPLSGLFDLLKMFKSGKSHMAIVTKEGEELQRAWRDGRPAFGVKVLGLVTLEDVIEELIGEESALHRIARSAAPHGGRRLTMTAAHHDRAFPLCAHSLPPPGRPSRAVYDEEDYQDDVLSAGGHAPQEAKLRRNASAFLERVPVAPGGFTNAANVLVDNIEREAFQSAGVKRVAAKFRRLRERAARVAGWAAAGYPLGSPNEGS